MEGEGLSPHPPLLLDIIIGDHPLQAVEATSFVPVWVSRGSDDSESISTFEGKVLCVCGGGGCRKRK